ncbi:MAG: hypothetical protein UX09_C0020G0013 [Candidatus Uhrbacteria bacterium GW2011_GWE2_45_35]|uniref:Uncharacterized protein n=2 Tax=Candidatus Uhriibacteriota TaxID=1752732 RepID=A0A0G1JGJ5_9BACT|nr:MAG: hypothetical protein UW63_C0025G0012 [Candidatus Uhrbacteria bacterium GW2011_GWF2_44_350]KKU08142.1 MAG: hypothetical protein UX09_C0020G0013 [Candidatus Uhrbacteria bacterium GW2011_GWE2_45_35]HBR80830.1 hypothetical protein [Candidatus Uhrbacteria bacterium]HCU31355.1 hypothetical protein [Candidatus Uhrbacteria bacterium]
MLFISTLAVVWFFLYWIIGGVFFACVALLRLIRLRKARFSCLFTLSAAVCAFLAAWFSTVWLERTASGCLADLPRGREALVLVFSCGFIQFLASAAAGLVVLLLIGFILLKLSSWKDRSWLTTFAEKLELDKKEEEEE